MTIALIAAAAAVFLVGAACGMLAAWRRYTLAIEDRDAQARRDRDSVADYMFKGVAVNQAILTLLKLQDAKRPCTIDWELLVRAAHGAGYTLVKTPAREAVERLN